MGLPQYGGEGQGKYKGNKSDMTLKQHGGEGKTLKTVSGNVAFTPSKTAKESYTGKGRFLDKKPF